VHKTHTHTYTKKIQFTIKNLLLKNGVKSTKQILLHVSTQSFVSVQCSKLHTKQLKYFSDKYLVTW